MSLSTLQCKNGINILHSFASFLEQIFLLSLAPLQMQELIKTAISFNLFAFTKERSELRHMKLQRIIGYLFSSRSIDSTFLTTTSDMVGFSLTIASKPAGRDILLGSKSSSFSSSDEEDDEEEEEE